MFAKLFGGEKEPLVPRLDLELNFNVDADKLKSQLGERVLDSSQQIFDENNGNAEGTFSVTSLRCIFVSKKKAANNIIIGYGRVTTMKITQSNGKVNLVINAFGGAASAKYDMCLHFNGESCPSSFETAISAFRAYDESRVCRDCRFRIPSTMNGHQVKLLHSERIARTINGAWSLSSESGSPGVMVITNLRLVWFADLTPDLNVSLPWLCVKSAPSARSSKFGDVLVILSADYRLGFRLDEFPTLAALEPLVEDLKHRRGSMIASPFFATDLYLETLPPLENPLEYNRKAEEVMYQASDAFATLAPVDVEDKPTVPVEALPSEQSPSADPTAPPGLEMSEKDLQEAFKRGRKAWGRSKIMIVGEGRAGKTALANSVMGKPFEETSSTVGINLFTCDIKYAAVGNGQWDKHESPDRLLEAALAQMIADEKFKRKHRVVKDFEFAEDVLNSSVTMVWAAEERELTEFSASVDISALRVEQVAESAVSTMDTEPPTATVIKKSMLSTASAEAVVMAAAVYPAPSTSKQNACAAEPDATIDNELVMKCLANGIQTESKFIISLFDFGGQSVFNVIHPFFLTKYGVYIVTFNMEWLASSADKASKDDCLAYMTFWVNSVVVHTKNEHDEVAPIVMVGTRKDKICDPAQHELISTTLYETFSNSVAWPFVIENPGATGANGKSDLFFYPVDNTLGREDTELQKMLAAVEKVIDESEYVHAEQPLSWLQTLDQLKSRQDSYVTYDEVVRLAGTCDVAESMVPKLLYFLHEMGMVMWHSDERLRDVIILDPIEYFVQPATIVICKHAPNKDDTIYHSLDIHKKVKKRMKSEWDAMVTSGVISEALFSALLDPASEEHKERILKLMLKYGLLVRIVSSDGGGAGSSEMPHAELTTSYMAPALLPENRAASDINATSFRKPWPTKSSLTPKNCQELGFLPSGLFERLICKAVSWCQGTSTGVETVDFSGLYKDEAVLHFGSQQFRMRLLSQFNLIEVIVGGDSAVAIHKRLRDQVAKVIAECMKSLKFSTLLEYTPQSDLLDSSHCFLRIQQVYDAMEKHDTLSVMLEGGVRELVNNAELVRRYGTWVQQFRTFDQYDVFLSYRWGNFDSTFVCSVFDRLTLFTIDDSHRSIVAFLDNHRLRMGEQIQGDLVKAVRNSRIFMPVVSADALARMKQHDPSIVDNVLLEWIIALNCHKHPVCRLSKVFPVLFGSRKDGAVGSLFTEKAIDELPDYSPDATIDLARALLREQGVSVKEDLICLSVKDVLNRMLQFMCTLGWKYTENAQLIAHVTQSLVNSLAEPEVSDAMFDAAPPAAAFTAEAVKQIENKPAIGDAQLTVHYHKESTPLETLTVEEVGYLMANIDLSMYIDDFAANRVDGEVLALSESVDDLKEVGVLKGIHAKKILKMTAEMKMSGVPRFRLVKP